jgi:hypothetical protein
MEKKWTRKAPGNTENTGKRMGGKRKPTVHHWTVNMWGHSLQPIQLNDSLINLTSLCSYWQRGFPRVIGQWWWFLFSVEEQKNLKKKVHLNSYVKESWSRQTRGTKSQLTGVKTLRKNRCK